MSGAYFRWTEAQREIFADIVQKESGFIRTDETMEVKWKKIIEKLKAKAEFTSLQVGWQSLQNQFKRFMEQVLKNCGISQEGANLSGLSDEPNKYVKLMLSIAEEKYKIEHGKKIEALKKKRKAQGQLQHETSTLAQQGNIVDENLNTSTSELSEDIPSGNSSTGRTLIETLQSQIADVVAACQDEETMQRKLRNEERMIALKEESIKMRSQQENRFLELQEKQLEIQKDQLTFNREQNELRKMELQLILDAIRNKN